MTAAVSIGMYCLNVLESADWGEGGGGGAGGTDGDLVLYNWYYSMGTAAWTMCATADKTAGQEWQAGREG